MSFINFKSVVAEPIDESSTMMMEQILNEKRTRENNFRQGLQMANRIINNNPMILANYWYVWTCRERNYSIVVEPEQMTRRMFKHMCVMIHVIDTIILSLLCMSFVFSSFVYLPLLFCFFVSFSILFF